MAGESNKTLTLESLLGACSGPSERVEDSSDLLSDLLGISAEPAEAPSPEDREAFDLESLPALPRIPENVEAALAEPASAPVPRTSPRLQPDPAREPEPELEPEPQPQPEPESRSEVVLQPRPEPELESQAQSQAKVEPQSISASKPRREPESKPVLEFELETQPKPTKAKLQPEAKLELEARAETKPRLKAKAQHKRKLGTTPASVLGPESKTQPESEFGPVSRRQPEFESEPAPTPASERQPKPKSEPAPVSAVEGRPVSQPAPGSRASAEPEKNGRHAHPVPAAPLEKPVESSRPRHGKHADQPATGNPRLDELHALRLKLLANMEAVSIEPLTQEPTSTQVAGSTSAPQSVPIRASTPTSATAPQPVAPPASQPAPTSFPDLARALKALRFKLPAKLRLANRTMRFAAAGALVLLLLGTSFALGPLLPAQHAADPSASDASGQPAAQNDESPAGSAGPPESRRSGSSQTAPGEDRSGTVVYRYVMAIAQDEAVTVTETVRFGTDGLCEQSTMEAAFADEDRAAAFLERLDRSYASAYLEGSVDGAKAVATIDVSANALDREGYEDTLRASVTDLAIVKKS